MAVFSLPEYGLIKQGNGDSESSDGESLLEKVSILPEDFKKLQEWVGKKNIGLPISLDGTPDGDDQRSAQDENEDREKIPFVYASKVHNAIKVQDYAGVILLPSGDQLEILPKIAKNFKDDKVKRGREILLRMIAAVYRLRTLQDAALDTARKPLYEIFIRCFLDEVKKLVRRGICSDYVEREDNITCLRGRLLLPRHIRANIVHKERFYVSYDEYLPDRPENRLVKTALHKAHTFCQNHENKRLCKLYLAYFDGIPKSQNVPADIKTCRNDRNMSHYKASLFWSRLILRGESPTPKPEQLQCTAILFNMPQLFEKYVALKLRQHVSDKWEVLEHKLYNKYASLVEGQDKYKLCPDLLLKKNGKNVAIADTKWKRLGSKSGDSEDNNDEGDGTSSAPGKSDMYQLFAYSEKYLREDNERQKEKQTSFLIYPQTDSFKDRLEYPFYEERSILYAVPFNLEEEEELCCPSLFELLQK
jgi:5-methylcytosine-specific restriction enzyme subunit McrC